MSRGGDAYGLTITNTALGSADAYADQKTVNKSNVKVGDTLTYTFRPSNGAGAAVAWQNARITDMLSEGLTFAGNVKMNGSTTNYTYDAAGPSSSPSPAKAAQ